MPTTPVLALPYPSGTNADNVPADMSALALAVEVKALGHTAGTAKRVHVQVNLTGTTDASGYCVFSHGAPFTPRVCQVTVARSALSLGYLISVDTVTSSQVTARFGNWSAGGALASVALGTNAISIISWE
jgi:hypothetical protein